MNQAIVEFWKRYNQFLRILKWMAWKRNQPDWDESLRAKFIEHEEKPTDEMWTQLKEEEKERFLKREVGDERK